MELSFDLADVHLTPGLRSTVGQAVGQGSDGINLSIEAPLAHYLVSQ